MPRITTPGRQHFDRNGNPLSAGLLYTRETDGTTDKATYPTEADTTAGTNANTNPIVLDDEGREPELWGSGDYWMNLKDSNLVQIDEWPKSPVNVSASINTPDLFYGLGLSNGTDADHDIDVAIGSCMDTTGVVRINLTTVFTKQIDATWVAGDDVGGLASGVSLTSSTWYHVFAVVVGGSADVMFDTSITCANGVANNGVTSYQYINSVLTDVSANILAFFNVNDYMLWDVIPTDVNNANPTTTTPVLATLSTPLGVSVMAHIGMSANSTAIVGNLLAYPTRQTTPTLSVSNCDMPTSNSSDQNINKDLLTDTSSQINYIHSISDATGEIYIHTNGWTILR